MDMITADICVKQGSRRFETKAARMAFSPHRCFSYDDGPDDLRCIAFMEQRLLAQEGRVALYARGPFLDYFQRHAPHAAARAACILIDAGSPSPDTSLPVHVIHEMPADIDTVFICATAINDRRQMKHRIGGRARIVDLEALATMDWRAIPAQAWVPAFHSIYPIDLPEIEFKSDQDLIVIDCPARNLAMLPNGLAYVHNALKLTGLAFQTIDLDVIAYHRFHMTRLFDYPGRVVTDGGYLMALDPWAIDAYEEWQNPEVQNFFRPLIDEIVTGIAAARPKILGLSLQASNIRFAREVVRGVRAACPEIIILVGGYSCYQASIGRKVFDECDYMCIGEADLTVGPLVKALVRGERPCNLPGVISRYDTPGAAFVEAPKPMDLDKLEMVKYEFADLQLYKNYDGSSMAPIIATRGCRWSLCTFCAERFLWRARSPQCVVDEFEFLASKGFEVFTFNESDLNGRPEIVLAICDEIIRRGLKLQLNGQLRINKKSDRAFFDKLVQAGFTSLRFGVDAWSANTLKLQKKGYTPAMITQNLRDCSKAGIAVTVNTVIGIPGETEEDIDDTIELMLANKDYVAIHANINPLVLVAGSVYWEQPERLGVKFRGTKEEIFEQYPVIIPEHLWYSEDPYIDHEVRMRRFKRVVRALYENGCRIGCFAERVIADLSEGKRAPGVRPELVSGISCENAPAARAGDSHAASTVDLLTAAPAIAHSGIYDVLRYGDHVYGVDRHEEPAVAAAIRESAHVRSQARVITAARAMVEKGCTIVREPFRLKMISTTCIRLMRTGGLRAVVRFVSGRLGTLSQAAALTIVTPRKVAPRHTVQTMSGPERVD